MEKLTPPVSRAKSLKDNIRSGLTDHLQGRKIHGTRKERHMPRKIRFLSGVLFAITLCFCFAARAGMSYTPEVQPRTDDGQVTYNPVKGGYRLLFHHQSTYDVDAVGTKNPIENWGESRLRFSPSLNWRDLYLKIEADILEGQIFGDHEDFASGFDRLDRRSRNDGLEISDILLRETYLQWCSKAGVLKAGHMTSGSGLGMLANTGRDEEGRFGVKRYGDIVERLSFSSAPFLPLTGKGRWGEHLTFFVAADLVFRDENADLIEGDLAPAASVGILYRHPDYTNGLVFTYRRQEDDDGDRLRAFVLNLNGRNRFALTAADRGGETGSDGFETALGLDYEFAALLGSTTRFEQLGAEEGLDLKGFGLVARLRQEFVSIGLDVEFEFGYASGDNNPYDDESTAFYFDPDYNVGLIFFDEMLPLITARSVDEMTDPERITAVPKGIDLVPSQGRVTNTIYYLPQISYVPPLGLGLDERLRLMLGALVLTTPARFSHAYYTFENGGTPTNHLRARTKSSYLGTELLAGVHFGLWPKQRHIALNLVLEHATFLPGEGLADGDGGLPDPVWKIIAGAELEWQ